MNTNIVYFDETGDDGLINRSSDTFILTSIYMKTEVWQENFNKIMDLKILLKKKYGFYIKEGKLPNRVINLIDKKFIGSVMATLKKANIFNLNANKANSYGLVIYPKE